ncbi:sporulation-specific protein 1 [Monosporozyma servazzii]
MDLHSLNNAIQPSMIYQLQQCVGRGNFGNVYKAINNITKDIVAIKVIDLENTDDDINTITQEIFFLAKLRDSHITHYITSMLDDSMLWIVMEYCGGGSCVDLIRFNHTFGIPEEKVAFIIFNVLHGLIYLHRQKIIHRDIKAANILLTLDGKIKMGDFGVSAQIQSTLKRNTFVGTPYWMAPEIVMNYKSSSSSSNNSNNNNYYNDDFNYGYNEMADIWSLGITVYELVTGSPPLSKMDPLTVMKLLPKGKPPRLIGDQYSMDVKGFIINCLQKDPLERPQALEMLKHPFILNNLGGVDNLQEDVKIANQAKRKHQIFKMANKRKRSVSTESEQYYGISQENDPSHDSDDVIDTWDFDINVPDRKLSLHRPETEFSSPTSSNILNYKNNSLSNNKLTVTPLTANDTAGLKHYPPSSPPPHSTHNISQLNKVVKYEFDSGMEIDPDSKSVPRSDKMDHPMEPDYINDIIGLCFEQMEARASDEETRAYVRTLLETFNAIEIEVPGFSEVFIEELKLRLETLDK